MSFNFNYGNMKEQMKKKLEETQKEMKVKMEQSMKTTANKNGEE